MPKEVKASQTYRTSPISVPSEAPCPSRAAAAWSASDDETLMAARSSGLNWQPIASKHFPTKTANACRKRHERLMERRNAEDWDGSKLETLAKEYMDVRKDMWSLLASRVGEKWQLIEVKCMEKGLKNLQAAYRAAHRKERGMGGDDSGIGGSDAEHETDEDHTGVERAAQQLEEIRSNRTGPSIQSMLSPSPHAT